MKKNWKEKMQKYEENIGKNSKKLEQKNLEKRSNNEKQENSVVGTCLVTRLTAYTLLMPRTCSEKTDFK